MSSFFVENIHHKNKQIIFLELYFKLFNKLLTVRKKLIFLKNMIVSHENTIKKIDQIKLFMITSS